MPKRHGDGSQKTGAPAASARQGQFTPTPRFTQPTSTTRQQPSSDRRPPLPAFSTPAPGGRGAAARDVVVDSSPASSSQPPARRARAGEAAHDSIEVDDSPARPRQWPPWSSDESDEDAAAGRSPKRLRVDASSPGIVDASSQLGGDESGGDGGGAYEEGAEEGYSYDDYDSDDSLGRTAPPSTDPPAGADVMATSDAASTTSSDDLDMNERPTDAPPQGHPVFHQPPRFKHAAPPPPPSQLPEAFSPSRRGAPYLRGGLAAELQDWLVRIKDADAPAARGARLAVHDVRHAGGLVLVRGRAEREGAEVRAVLAGRGRTEGLAAASVRRGDVVGVFPPAWDVDLHDGSRWAVACDWAVTGDETPQPELPLPRR